jgi:chromosome segregation ATPase
MYKEINNILHQENELDSQMMDSSNQNKESSYSPVRINRKNSVKVDQNMKNKLIDSRKERVVLENRIEELNNTIDRDNKNHIDEMKIKNQKVDECEERIYSLEHELRIKSEELDLLKEEFALCKLKIPDLKIKLDTIHMSQINYEKEDSSRLSFEKKQNKEIKKFEGHIHDLNHSITHLKTIETTLKEQLEKKEDQLHRANQFMQIYQDEKDAIKEENNQLKKEIISLKNKRNSNSDYTKLKELEKNVELYQHNIRLLEEDKNQFKKKIEKEKKVIVNKNEQNHTMVDLLKVMKQEISLLQSHVQSNNELIHDFKSLKAKENEVLLELQKIAENQVSDSELEYEEGIR